MMIKRFLRGALKRFGVVAFKRSSRVYIPEEETYRIVSVLAGCPDPVVIDGGTHLGDMVERFGALLPRSEFHCFEPDPMLGEILVRKFTGNSKINIVHAALGDVAGKATFNINVSRPTNSLLPTSESLQPDLKQLCELVEQVEVEVVTIDDYCRANSIDRVDIIKLDLQGYDYLALKGASGMLEKAKVVLVEVLFKEFYQGCHLFPDVLGFMLDNGFELHTLCGLHYGHHDELLWSDAIFVKNGNGAPSAKPQQGGGPSV
ncbi:FkbM family methyltransferase [Thiobacillus sp.]|uniref:FkbM family methyltransferase n=1 Tax=Thiobacillus sp. TaxID=924 RepID=UPI0025D39BB8|nr:FkbM family methyltransferase [Thiobacillus sp.]